MIHERLDASLGLCLGSLGGRRGDRIPLGDLLHRLVDPAQLMVDLGVLEETTEPANSSIFIVQKSSGKWRLICDLRAYNSKIQDYIVLKCKVIASYIF